MRTTWVLRNGQWVDKAATPPCIHLRLPTCRPAEGAWERRTYGPFVYDRPMVCKFCGDVDL